MLIDILKKYYNLIFEFFEEKERPAFIDFLTGFRGTLAISVICHHVAIHFAGSGDISLFKGMGHWYGVYGFFFLSSFLLTYRLLIDLKETNHFKIQIALVIIKYFIRRFFRIYLPYVVFCTMVKLYPKFGNAHNNHHAWRYVELKLLVTLHHPGSSHLWTIAPEIKYYFFPPVFALLIYKTKKFSWLALTLSSLLAYIYDSYFFNFDERYFSSYFPIFFKGSLVGIFYFKLENKPVFTKYKTFLRLNYFAAFALGFYYILLIRNSSELLSLPKKFIVQSADSVKYFSYNWLFFLSIMLLFAPNRFTNVFMTRFLQKLGKYSYGIYLMHPYGLALTSDYLPKSNSGFEQIILCLIFSYCSGKVFYFLIEFPLVKMAKFFCKQIDNVAESNTKNYYIPNQ